MLSEEQLSVLDTIIDESQIYFEDTIVFENFVSVGMEEFGKTIPRISDIKIGSVVLTPVEVIIMKNPSLNKIYNVWCETFNNDEDLDFTREDFAYVVGFFKSMMNVEAVAKYFSESEQTEILNSTIAFAVGIVERMTQEKMKELL